MAPFKLKFRMGSSSRSTSQETEEPVQQPLLTRQTAVGGSNTTINSDFNSMSINNDQHNLLPNTFEEETGYENPSIMRTMAEADRYQNIQRTSSNSIISRNDQFHSDCEENAAPNIGTTYNNTSEERTMGEQLFLSNPTRSNDNLLDSTAGSCDPLFLNQSLEQIDSEDEGAGGTLTSNERDCSSNSSLDNRNLEDDWNLHENQLQDQQLQTTLDTIISNKSSKKIYKAVAKEWGITCKMSEQCRCFDCQGNYFDCEYDENEHQKTDGGLGASTPMFLNEVLHQSACTII